MNHLLIDFENLQPANLDRLDDKNTCIWLFLGLHQQRNIELELCESLCRFGKNVRFIRLEKSGKNALDFYISFYLGRIIESDPHAQIAILSRDGGYDTLVEHIRNRNPAAVVGRVGQTEMVAAPAPCEKPSDEPAPSPSENEQSPEPADSLEPFYRAAVTALRRADAHRPRRLANLEGNLRNYLLRGLLAEQSPEEQQETVGKVIRKLEWRRLVSIDAESSTVAYFLSDADAEELLCRHIRNTQPKTQHALREALRQKGEKLCVGVGDVLIGRLIARMQADRTLHIAADGSVSYPPKETAPPSADGAELPPLGDKERQKIDNRIRALLSRPTVRKARTPCKTASAPCSNRFRRPVPSTSRPKHKAKSNACAARKPSRSKGRKSFMPKSPDSPPSR